MGARSTPWPLQVHIRFSRILVGLDSMLPCADEVYASSLPLMARHKLSLVCPVACRVQKKTNSVTLACLKLPCGTAAPE